MADLPRGTVTFLFTDIEASMRRWEQDPVAMRSAVERHFALLRGTLERRRGRKVAWKGRFHDAARSQSGHVVTSDGIHWVCVMLLVPVPWCRRR